MDNPARGLLNRGKKKKEKVWQRPPYPRALLDRRKIGVDRPPKEAMPVARQEYLGFGVLRWERKVIRAEKIADGRVPLPARSGYIRKIGVQFWRKVDVAGYTPPFFGHGRVKVGVDQSAFRFTL